MFIVSAVCILLIVAGFWSRRQLERKDDLFDFKANIYRLLVVALPYAIITLTITIVIFIVLLILVFTSD